MPADFNKLRLAANGETDKLWEILQAESRHKCRKKLALTLAEHPGFMFPSTALAEMSTSDAAADFHASLFAPGSTILDMTAGLGIDTLHFAKVARHVTAIESDKKTAECLKINMQALDNVTIINGDSIEYLENSDSSFDIIFIDPARRDNAGRHWRLADCRPDILGSLHLLTSRAKKVIIKASPMVDIAQARREIKHECDITVLGTPKECKELIITLPGEGKNMAVTIGVTETPPTTEEGPFLLLPYPAVMKTGAFYELEHRFNLPQIHPSTHLFISDSFQKEFPGKHFKILDTIPFNKQSIRTFPTNYPIINISTRNFPLSPSELAKKLKVNEGGNLQLFAATDRDNQKKLYVTKPV